MKVDQVRDSVSCRVDEVRYFVKIVDVVRVDQVRVDQVGCSRIYTLTMSSNLKIYMSMIKKLILLFYTQVVCQN